MTVKNVEKLEKSRVALEIEVSGEEFEAALAKSYAKMRSRLRVPGFRPGKAPRKVVEKMYGVEVFFNDAVDESAPGAYEDAVESEKLDTIGYPNLELVGDGIAVEADDFHSVQQRLGNGVGGIGCADKQHI